TVRRDGVPVDDARRQPLLRSPWTRLRADQDRLPPGIELVLVRRTVHELPGLSVFARVADPVGVAHRRLEGVLRVAVPEGLWEIARAGVAGLDRLRERLPAPQHRGNQEV